MVATLAAGTQKRHGGLRKAGIEEHGNRGPKTEVVVGRNTAGGPGSRRGSKLSNALKTLAYPSLAISTAMASLTPSMLWVPSTVTSFGPVPSP